MLQRAVLQRGFADHRFSAFVAFQDVHEFLLVGFGGCFHFVAGLVGGPEVGVAAILVEGFGRDEGSGVFGGGTCC